MKIRTLTAPRLPLADFDPGEYLSGLEFDETSSPITDEDRDGLAQFAHYLAFMALEGRSSRWANSRVPGNSQAYRALQSHFGHLRGWPGLAKGESGLLHRELATFLLQHYPPRMPEGETSDFHAAARSFGSRGIFGRPCCPGGGGAARIRFSPLRP